MTLTLILALLSGISNLFSKYEGTGLEALIQSGLTALGQLLTSWVKGSPFADILSALQAIQTVLQGLAQNPSTDVADLPLIGELTKITLAGIQGYQKAAAGSDPGLLPVPPAVT
jgi:hypothetical protein